MENSQSVVGRICEGQFHLHVQNKHKRTPVHPVCRCWFSDDVMCSITWCTWGRRLLSSWRLHSTSFVGQFTVHSGSQ